MKTRRRGSMMFAAAALLAAGLSCGARSQLDAPVVQGAGGGGGGGADAGPRRCAPNCTVGHRCCAGSCDGPSVPLPNDCCMCVAGEVSSLDCPGALCGGD